VNLTAAALVAQVVSFAAFITAAVWYAVPWMRRRPLELAVPALLWVHVFRAIAMQVFSARNAGFAISIAFARQIAWGDVIGAVLALACLWLLRHRSRWALPLLWVFVAETVIDLLNDTVQGVHEMAFATASAVSWILLNMYSPLLWVTAVLIAWRLARGTDAIPTEAPIEVSRGARRPHRVPAIRPRKL
jgi:hypothetical protein